MGRGPAGEREKPPSEKKSDDVLLQPDWAKRRRRRSERERERERADGADGHQIEGEARQREKILLSSLAPRIERATPPTLLTL